MHYLVTGGAGFIGTHLSNTLVEAGHQVRVLDDLSFGDASKLNSKIEFIQGNIQDLADCEKAVKGVDGIFHMAAFSRSGPSFDMPFECHESNALGTLNVLAAARKHGVKRLVYSGSSTFYGNHPGVQNEKDAGDFLNYYGLTKHVGELYVQQYVRNFGLEANILRYFNVYGPGQPSTGAYALVVGIFLNKYRNKETLEIHGSGEQRRDFIHVADVVQANIKAMETQHVGEIFNVGSGINYSVNELAAFFPLEKIHTESRAGDANTTLADVEKITSMLGWKPQITLEEGIKSMIQAIDDELN
ncbi:MAG: NAD-dependent epimerase/dehydratase family protein [Aquirufa sp.]|jgi:nucleoside-diphosphate-sugar epimerase